jgi:hypothetical protein
MTRGVPVLLSENGCLKGKAKHPSHPAQNLCRPEDHGRAELMHRRVLKKTKANLRADPGWVSHGDGDEWLTHRQRSSAGRG